MTNEQLQSAAAAALKSLPDGYEVISANVVYASRSTSDVSTPSFAWLKLSNSGKQPNEIVFPLYSEDSESISKEILRHISRTSESSTNFIRNELEVTGSVSGLVVGTNTGVINRNYFGGDTYQQVQFYVLSESGRNSKMRGLFREFTEPYKFLSPYGALDLPIFKGRDNEINQLVQIIHEQRLVVVTGEASVGKTSLLAAGVIPELLDEGLLVIKIQDYSNAVEIISQAIKSQQDNLKIPLPDNLTLQRLIESITKVTGSLVLVFDQFELLFEASIAQEQRERLIDEIATCLREIPSSALRLVIVIRDEVKSKLWEHQERLPELLRCQFPLAPLDPEQAALAIREPLRLVKSQVLFHADVVERLLVPGLAELGSGAEPTLVHPPHLQIVCTWLYRKATETDPPRIIDKELLMQVKGADGIFANYLEETLKKLEDERRLSSRILELMARPEVEKWVFPIQLHEMNPDVSLIDIERVLETLVRVGLLVRRAGDGKYAFVSPTVATEILRLAGPEVEKRSQAGYEVERIWLAWLARNAWASNEQLRYLESFGSHLTPRAVKTMLLLRSAVERDEPPASWLDLLRNEEGRALIYRLEGLAPRANFPANSEIVLTKAEKILDLPENADDNEVEEHISVGPIALNAVNHPNPVVRQTCALSLSTIDDEAAVALGRLDQALAEKNGGRQSLRVELRGALADAVPRVEEKNRELPVLDRSLIWQWRARRRVDRDSYRWIRLTIGGAIGASVGIGLLRWAVAVLFEQFGNNVSPLIQGTMYFFYAWIVGAAFSLGTSLAKPLFDKNSPVRCVTTARQTRIQDSLASILLGGIFFGLAHLLALFINGEQFSANNLSAGFGFVAGLGLGLAVYLQRHLRPPLLGWSLGLFSGATTFAIVHFILAQYKQYLVFVWNKNAYFSGFDFFLSKGHPEIVARYPAWADWLALADAALVGLFLTAGVCIGFKLTHKSLQKHRALSSTMESP